MKQIHFPNWMEVLERSQLPAGAKKWFPITISWYLRFCQRTRAGVNVQSARDFIDWARERKQAEAWKVERWKEAIRWFFRASKRSEVQPEVKVEEIDCPVWLPEEQAQWPSWKKSFLTVVRRRKYSYRTEQSYLGWAERFAREHAGEELESLGEGAISAFLDQLALDSNLSASSQRQALNALVFLFREVFGKELGDFSDYRRAKARTNLPVWLTREELKSFFAELEEPWLLMAQVMYGGGLRLMDLLRLRVKDVDLTEEIIGRTGAFNLW